MQLAGLVHCFVQIVVRKKRSHNLTLFVRPHNQIVTRPADHSRAVPLDLWKGIERTPNHYLQDH